MSDRRPKLQATFPRGNGGRVEGGKVCWQHEIVRENLRGGVNSAYTYEVSYREELDIPPETRPRRSVLRTTRPPHLYDICY